jgi:ATP-dependent Clp protease ATP-binding subunit ClpA
VKAAVELLSRYIHDRKLPDKAIDVIDETGASQMLVPEPSAATISQGDRGDGRLDGAGSAEVGVRTTPVLQHLEQTLKRAAYGQTRRWRRWLRRSSFPRGLAIRKPIGCYPFSGPTGVGKTEACQLLGRPWTGADRFDMSEYGAPYGPARSARRPYVGFDQAAC